MKYEDQLSYFFTAYATRLRLPTVVFHVLHNAEVNNKSRNQKDILKEEFDCDATSTLATKSARISLEAVEFLTCSSRSLSCLVAPRLPKRKADMGPTITVEVILRT